MGVWDESLKRFRRKTFTCPMCDTKQSAEPISVKGAAINNGASGINVTVMVDATFPVFLDYSNPRHPGYGVCQCKSCEDRVVVEMPFYERGELTVVWPIPGTSVSQDIPLPIRLAVTDAKLSHAVDSKTGAIMSLRTSVIRLQRDKDVSCLTELWEKERLPPTFFDAANEPRHWGNVIGHDDFDYEGVTREQVGELIAFMDIVLEMVYLIPARLVRTLAARQSIEQTETQEPPSSGDTDLD